MFSLLTHAGSAWHLGCYNWSPSPTNGTLESCGKFFSNIQKAKQILQDVF